MARVLAWLATFGLPVAAFLKPETLLPPRPWGLIVWLAAIVGALALGVMATYRHRSEREDEAATRRAARDAKRRPVVVQIYQLTRDYQRLQRAIGSESSVEADAAIKAIKESLAEYTAATRVLGQFEAEDHIRIQTDIRAGLEGEIQSLPALANRISVPIFEALAYASHFGGRGIDLDDDEWGLIQHWRGAGPNIRAIFEELDRRAARKRSPTPPADQPPTKAGG